MCVYVFMYIHIYLCVCYKTITWALLSSKHTAGYGKGGTELSFGVSFDPRHSQIALHKKICNTFIFLLRGQKKK